MELFAADGHDAGGCERVTGKSGMRPVPQAQGPGRPDQLLASRWLLHPRRTRRLRRARPVVVRRGPLLPRRHPDLDRRVLRQPRRGRTLRRRVGQPAPGWHPGRVAQTRRRRAADAAQARPVPLLRARPRAPDAPTARSTPADGHARTRTAPARRRPDTGGVARGDRVVRQPARRTAAASVRRPRVAQVRVGWRPTHRHLARHRPVHGRDGTTTTRRARCRGRPGAARGRRTPPDRKKRRKSSPAKP